MSGAGWTCATCTYQNSPARTLCELCQTERPVGAPTPAPTPASKPVPAGSWTCPTCTLQNEKARTRCGACDTAKPASTSQTAHASDALARLKSLGFSDSLAKTAFDQAGGDADRAVEWALQHGNSSEAKRSQEPVPVHVAETKAEKQARLKREAKRRELELLLEQQQASQNKQGPKAEDRRKQVEEARALALEKAREAERLEKAKAMEKLVQDKQREKAARKLQRERERERLKKSSQFADAKEAIADLRESYSVPRFLETIRLLHKVVCNIISHPDEPKYRTIKKNEKVDRALVRPLGARYLMRDLGFKESKEDFKLAKVNASKLRMRKAFFESFLSTTSTSVKTALQSLRGEESKDTVSDEVKYFCLEELKTIFQNVLTAPESHDFRTINMTAPMFKKRLRKVPAVMSILSDFGFVKKPDVPFLFVEEPNLDKMQTAVVELAEELKRRAPTLPICKAIGQLLQANEENTQLTGAFLRSVEGCLKRIVEFPHERKFHRIKLRALLKKVGKVKGGKMFFKFFGFEVSKEEDSWFAVMPYPKGFDPDLLGRRLRLLQALANQIAPETSLSL